MSELADLLELIHGASARIQSVEATIVERRRPPLLEQAFRRFAERVDKTQIRITSSEVPLHELLKSAGQLIQA